MRTIVTSSRVCANYCKQCLWANFFCRVHWLFPPWQWTQGHQLQIHPSIHPWMEKESAWNRNNRTWKRKKKRSKAYTQVCLSQTWSSEAPGHLCYRQGDGRGAAENRVHLLCASWQNIILLRCCPDRLQKAHQGGHGWGILPEFLAFVQERLWCTSSSSII